MVKNKVDEIETLLAEIQFDRWVFGFPRCTVVSHGHKDHDPFQASVSLAEPLIFGSKFVDRFSEVARSMRKLPDHERLSDGEFTEIVLNRRRVRFRCLGRRSFSKLTGIGLDRLHADWWAISTKSLLVIFVGELDGVELPLLSKLLEDYPNIDAAVLPSYGQIKDIAKHRMKDPDELRREVAKIAWREREKGRLIYTLPHPVAPEWSVKTAHYL